MHTNLRYEMMSRKQGNEMHIGCFLSVYFFLSFGVAPADPSTAVRASLCCCFVSSSFFLHSWLKRSVVFSFLLLLLLFFVSFLLFFFGGRKMKRKVTK
jgi:hypothetical protein